MGHIFDLSTYLSKEDLLSLDSRTQNSAVLKELDLINREVLEIVKGGVTADLQAKDYLYKLSIRLEQFVKKYGRELKFMPRLKIELLELLHKVNKLNIYRSNFTSERIESIAHLLQKQMGSYLPAEMILDLIVYETFEHLGLTSELGIQDKLSITKVRDVDTYSMLMTKYKKPKIYQDHLEHYFELNRNELLLQLVSSAKTIKHIHYDFEYLHQFISLKLLLALKGEDINIHINEQVRNVFV